jgi:hypothetical protein
MEQIKRQISEYTGMPDSMENWDLEGLSTDSDAKV